MEDLYAEIMQLQGVLNVTNPKRLPDSTSQETIDYLKDLGYEEGDYIPSNMADYFDAVSKLIIPESTDPALLRKHYFRKEKLREAMQQEAVKDTLRNVLARIKDAVNKEAVADQRVKDKLGGDVDLANPAMQTIYEGLKREEEEKIQKALEEQSSDKNSLEDVYSGAATENIDEGPKVLYKMQCPRCRLNLNEEYESSPIDDASRRDYLAYVLGGTCFRREYPIWNDMAKLTFQTWDIKKEQLIKEQYAFDFQNGNLSLAPLVDFRYNLYKAALSLVQIKYSPSLNMNTILFPDILSDAYAPTDSSTRLNRYVELVFTKNVPSKELLSEILTAYNKFDDQLRILKESLYSKDFWNGATSD